MCPFLFCGNDHFRTSPPHPKCEGVLLVSEMSDASDTHGSDSEETGREPPCLAAQTGFRTRSDTYYGCVCLSRWALMVFSTWYFVTPKDSAICRMVTP